MNKITQALVLANELYDGKKKNNEPVINHCKRLANIGVLLDFDELSLAICYLHKALEQNYDDYYNIGLRIKEIDPNLFKYVDKLTKKHNETWNQYYYRLRLVPEIKQVMYINMLDELFTAPEEDRKRIYENLKHFI
jgi:(p)ppGpp synthase/HD superfamily hydrolase